MAPFGAGDAAPGAMNSDGPGSSVRAGAELGGKSRCVGGRGTIPPAASRSDASWEGPVLVPSYFHLTLHLPPPLACC